MTDSDVSVRSTEDGTDYFTFSVEVPVREASDHQRKLFREMAKIYARHYSQFIKKNLDYGSSFTDGGEVEQLISNGDGPFDSAYDANLYRLFTRIEDKHNRFYRQAIEDADNNVGEDIRETAGDAGNYWFMVELLSRREQALHREMETTE